MNLGSLVIPGESSTAYILVVLALLLLIFLIILTVRRKNKHRLVLRIVLSCTIVFSLFLIALQPQWATTSASVKAILITPGAELKTIENFVDSLRTKLQIFALDSTVKRQSLIHDAKTIPDLAYIKRHYPEIQTLHVFGYGLPDYAWQEIKSLKIKYQPTLPPPGISQIYWPLKVQIGQTLQIQGSVSGLSDKENWLYLSGPGGLADSVLIGVGHSEPFELNTVPLDTGRHLYTLSLKSNDRILFQEKKGISVVPPSPMKILLFEESPRFETKYLKNWLTKQQSSLAIRTSVSHKRFRFEYLNFPEKVDLNQITAPLLQRFDLLIIDGKTLSYLASTEYKALISSVESGGLGLLIMPDQTFLDKKRKKSEKDILYSKFKLNQFSELEHRMVKLTIPNSLDSLVTPISAEPFELAEQWGMQPLFKDHTGKILAGTFRSGKGMIGISLIKNTYKWILEGNPQFHAGYWSHLMSELVRKDFQNDKWTFGRQNPVSVNQPLELRLSTQAIHPICEVQTELDSRDEIYLRQDKLNPALWHGTFWPKQEGWHCISTQKGEPFWFYVHENTDWQTWRQFQKVEATKRMVARNLDNKKVTNDGNLVHATAVPLIWVYLLFLLSSAFMWLEQKI